MAIIKCCCFELRCQINFSKQWIFSGSPATQQKQNTLISAYTFYNQTTLIILILPTTWSPRPRTIWKTCKRIVWNRSLQKIDGNNNLQNLRQYLSGPTSCNTSQYFFCFNWKVKRRLQDTCVRKISSHFRCCCPHLHQWMLGGTKEFGNQTYSHCPQPTEWQLVAAAVSQSPPPPSLSAGWPASRAWRPSPTSPCATHQKCPQKEEWTQYPLPHTGCCTFPSWCLKSVGLHYLHPPTFRTSSWIDPKW